MLVRRPELLVLDDLSALDVQTEALLWRQLRADTSRTILAVSHRRPALLAADRIIVMRDGHFEA
jgi:ATP-binding cassette subfamily B protein